LYVLTEASSTLDVLLQCLNIRLFIIWLVKCR